MTARPWMPFYIADYLADTAHLGALQSGAYVHLIMHYWQHGKLPDNDAALARIARVTPAEWRRERPVIVAFFQDGWKHKRIDAELAHAAEVTSKRSDAAGKRWGKGNANASGNGSPNAEPMDTHSHSQLQEKISPSPKLNGGSAALMAKLINGAAKKMEQSNHVWLKPDDTRVERAKTWHREHFSAELQMQFKGSKPGYSVPWEAVR